MKKIQVSPGACILLSFLLLTVPLKWLLAAWGAAMVHELCHLAAIRACGGTVCEIRVGAGGAILETGPMTAGRELLCALAGPFGSLLLSLLLRRFPELAICGLVQGIYNLFPLFPLDGGRALRCLLSFAGRKGERGFRIIEKIFLCILMGILLWFFFRSAAVAVLGCFFFFPYKIFLQTSGTKSTIGKD